MMNRVKETLTRLGWVIGLAVLAGSLLSNPTLAFENPVSNPAPASPVFLQADCPGNMLVNPSFEGGGRKTESLGTSLSSAVAHGWFPWFIRGNQQYNREPEFKVEDATRDPLRWRVHHGYFSQKFFTTWATHDAGIYQRVPVPPGSVINFSIWVQVYTGERDGWDGKKHNSDRQAPGNYRTYVGIDPYGNTPLAVGAPPPDTVIWSDPIMVMDQWTQMSIQAVAQADFVTVYTRGQPEFAVKHNDSFWDDACLTIAGAVPPPMTSDAVVDTPALNFRAGPGTEYDVIGVLRQGDPLTVEARLANNSWLNVTDENGKEGWVFAGLLRIGINLSDVPVAQDIPPTPTPLPTPTPTSTPTPLPTATPIPPTPTPSPTDTPPPTATPEPTQPAAPNAADTAAETAVAVRTENDPPAGPQPQAETQANPENPESSTNRRSEALSCVPALLMMGLGLFGLSLWPRRR